MKIGGAYVAPPRVYEQLVEVSSGVFTLTNPVNKATYHFEGGEAHLAGF